MPKTPDMLYDDTAVNPQTGAIVNGTIADPGVYVGGGAPPYASGGYPNAELEAARAIDAAVYGIVNMQSDKFDSYSRWLDGVFGQEPCPEQEDPRRRPQCCNPSTSSNGDDRGWWFDEDKTQAGPCQAVRGGWAYGVWTKSSAPGCKVENKCSGPNRNLCKALGGRQYPRIDPIGSLSDFLFTTPEVESPETSGRKLGARGQPVQFGQGEAQRLYRKSGEMVPGYTKLTCAYPLGQFANNPEAVADFIKAYDPNLKAPGTFDCTAKNDLFKILQAFALEQVGGVDDRTCYNFVGSGKDIGGGGEKSVGRPGPCARVHVIGEDGDLARSWFRRLDRTCQVALGEAYCNQHPEALECACIYRADSKVYQDILEVSKRCGAGGAFSGSIDDSCWYGPCKDPNAAFIASGVGVSKCPDKICEQVFCVGDILKSNVTVQQYLDCGGDPATKIVKEKDTTVNNSTSSEVAKWLQQYWYVPLLLAAGLLLIVIAAISIVRGSRAGGSSGTASGLSGGGGGGGSAGANE
jgi:hypothetical protein